MGYTKEVAYSLPSAFEYMRSNPDGAREFLSGVFCFVSENLIQLRQDGLLDRIENAVRACFETWTSQFTVHHYDADACKEKGWRLEYFDYVSKSEAVQEFLESLRGYTALQPLASELIESLATASGGPKSAWLLEYARKTGEFTFQEDLLVKHYKAIKPTLVCGETSPTYWPTLLKVLRLSADPA